MKWSIRCLPFSFPDMVYVLTGVSCYMHVLLTLFVVLVVWLTLLAGVFNCRVTHVLTFLWRIVAMEWMPTTSNQQRYRMCRCICCICSLLPCMFIHPPSDTFVELIKIYKRAFYCCNIHETVYNKWPEQLTQRILHDQATDSSVSGTVLCGQSVLIVHFIPRFVSLLNYSWHFSVQISPQTM